MGQWSQGSLVRQYRNYLTLLIYVLNSFYMFQLIIDLLFQEDGRSQQSSKAFPSPSTNSSFGCTSFSIGSAIADTISTYSLPT
jgi:hypothetical protein